MRQRIDEGMADAVFGRDAAAAFCDDLEDTGVDCGRIRAKAYEVEIKRGADLFDGPYRAETVAVSVEEYYLVVEASVRP